MKIILKKLLLAMTALYAVESVAAQGEMDDVKFARMQELRKSAQTSNAVARSNSASASADSSACVTDADIKNALLSATVPMCDYDAYKRRYQHAVALCNGDDVRFSRIAEDIARERHDRVSWAIRALANHGSVKNLPFLYSFSNDVRHAAMAMTSIIYIEGVTERSMEAACNVARMGMDDPSSMYYICAAIKHAATKHGDSPDGKRLAVETLKKFAIGSKEVSLSADRFIMEIDPSYETSEDRKALLREVAERRVNDYQIDYATNALKRIDAKIQSERKGD